MQRIERETVQNIISHLVARDGEINGYFVTGTREEYDLLLRAAFGGQTPENVDLRRSGLWLGRKRITPPDSVLFR